MKKKHIQLGLFSYHFNDFFSVFLVFTKTVRQFSLCGGNALPLQEKTMEIRYDKSQDWDSFLSEVQKAKDGVGRLREQIIRHCTVTSATLIGLIAVFGNRPQHDNVLRGLLLLSVLFLFLSVLAGVLYSFLYVSLNLRSLRKCVELYATGGGEAGVRQPFLGLLAKVFPWLLCLGVLLLSASVVYALLFH